MRMTRALMIIVCLAGVVVVPAAFLNLKNGNALARITASADKKEHVPGEVFKLVTRKNEPGPYWFGSDINGEIQTIERIQVSTAADSLHYDYTCMIKASHKNVLLIEKTG